MTREQALTRKVAQLRMVAEGGENTLAIGPGEIPAEASALHFAIAAVVLIAIAVLGVGLFAATQAGLFDGLENRIPFLRPKVSGLHAKPAHVVARPMSAPASAAAPGNQPSVPVHSAAPSPDVAPGNQPSNPPVTHPSVAARPAAARIAKPAPAPKPVRPEAARRAAAQQFAAEPLDALPPPPAAAAPVATPPETDVGEIPAPAKPRSKPSNQGEIILRAAVQAATNIDKDNLQELYDRYALGFPGLSGDVVIGLTVDPGGHVMEGSVVSSSTGVDAFDQELLRKVLDWRLRAFPESRPKFITVPFLFPLQGR